MRSPLIVLILSFINISANCQIVADTSKLDEVIVTSYFSEQPILGVPSSISLINSEILQNQAGHSLLSAINTAPGVRMEERSPGSYRLSIRGSLLRSPFGVRNVKVYLDDFLLSDAGGNTYLNLLDASSVGSIEILKGPEGSIFGANSGGVVLISSELVKQDSSLISAGITAGSYGLFRQDVSLKTKTNTFEIALNEAVQHSDGYRQNSELNRKSIQLTPRWKYSNSAILSSLIMYSDLDYQTPGGLTQAQVRQNARLARPATSAVPGAAEQQAGIFNKTFLAGLSHSKLFSPKLRHVVSLTGSFTDFVNPFITTYEIREEKSLGLRTYIELSSRNESSNSWKWQLGAEGQQTSSEKKNYNNLSGEVGEPQDFVDFKGYQGFFFSHLTFKPTNRLTTEAAISLSFYRYNFKGIYPVASEWQDRAFKAQLLPRLALSYFLTDYLALRASASKGYSPPTIEEVRPSSREINTDLQPEAGWNFETGIRLSIFNNRVYFDNVVFHYKLKDAIVRRVNSADTEYFVNAGGTKQTGLETQLNAWVVPLKNSGWMRGAKFSESYSWSRFKFESYIVNSSDFSGNKLTGVPRHNLVSSVNLYFPLNLNLYLQHAYVSSMPLNDANTQFADKYHLLQAKLSVQKKVNAYIIKVFAGADNIFNSKYSLGHDLNAFGARFYNPAPPRNFYGGIITQF
ncbi:TonB-dependent receptor [Pedobacter sp. P351]|uniref:TonB-dependent receptor n=1 Tax=Pedobacter superstes TaxID=3133441 RepID=UPI0030989300